MKKSCEDCENLENLENLNKSKTEETTNSKMLTTNSKMNESLEDIKNKINFTKEVQFKEENNENLRNSMEIPKIQETLSKIILVPFSEEE